MAAYLEIEKVIGREILDMSIVFRKFNFCRSAAVS